MDYHYGGGRQKVEAIIILRTVYTYDVPWFVFLAFLLSAAKSAVALCLNCARVRPYDIVQGVVLV